MTIVSAWILFLASMSPAIGIVVALTLISGRARSLESAVETLPAVSNAPLGTRPTGATIAFQSDYSYWELRHALVRLGIQGGIVASLALFVVLVGFTSATSSVANWEIGTALELLQPTEMRIAWGWRANPVTALWIAATGILTLRAIKDATREQRNQSTFAVVVLMGICHVAVNWFLLATSLPQMLFFWEAILLSTCLLISCTTPDTPSINPAWKVATTSLVTDLFLASAVLCLFMAGHTLVVDELVSVEGLVNLKLQSAALPGFIGSLFVLSILGRCGLFPWFGWNDGADQWKKSTRTIVYFTSFVPSAVWLILRFEPLVNSSSVGREMLGEFGLLGAILGTVVACGQIKRGVAINFLLTSQVGVLLSAVSCGLADIEHVRSLWSGESVPKSMEFIRLIVGQLAVLFGAIFIQRSIPSANAKARQRPWGEPLGSLFENKLHIDVIAELLITRPLIGLSRFLDATQSLFDTSIVSRVVDDFPAWCGQQIESMHSIDLRFNLVANILTIGVILLTLFLIA